MAIQPNELTLRYYADKVRVLNPYGTVAVLTLWSKVDGVLAKLGEPPPCVAAISNFYGDGISQLLANLLYNPQIDTVAVCGANLSKSWEELSTYFADGTEAVVINGAPQVRVRGTTRLLNEALADPDLFRDGRPDLVRCEDRDLGALRRFLADYRSPDWQPRERRVVELVEREAATFPSIAAGHQVVAGSLLEAWAEVLFLLCRYGQDVELVKGRRRELISLKVVVTAPDWATAADYAAHNLDEAALRRYAADILDPKLAPDRQYSYGHRLRTYFGLDSLDAAAGRLAANREDRRCYISLWDQRTDLTDTVSGHPCLVGLFLRVYQGKLHLTATFRTHRAYTAWIENAHGLLAILQGMAARVGVPPGTMTLFSQSIALDPLQLPLAESVVGRRAWTMRDDGRGDLVFAVTGDTITVEHRAGGLPLKRYEGKNAETLGHQLAQDHVVSDLSHAIYIGRQLGKAQMCLRHGLPYEPS